MRPWQRVLNGAEAQGRFGAQLAAVCPPRVMIYLQGDLGTGKTTLVRGFLRGRGEQGAVRSPTFTLVESYDLKDGKLYHLDLYRLADPQELEFLGWRDLVAEQAVVFVEWPERGAGWLPEPDLLIVLEHRESGRVVKLLPKSPTGHALLRALTELIPEND
jgi:tRNA threonylcarbamoyladenosine biosynthesis protein TsaE